MHGRRKFKADVYTRQTASSILSHGYSVSAELSAAITSAWSSVYTFRLGRSAGRGGAGRGVVCFAEVELPAAGRLDASPYHTHKSTTRVHTTMSHTRAPNMGWDIGCSDVRVDPLPARVPQLFDPSTEGSHHMHRRSHRSRYSVNICRQAMPTACYKQPVDVQ